MFKLSCLLSAACDFVISLSTNIYMIIAFRALAGLSASGLMSGLVTLQRVLALPCTFKHIFLAQSIVLALVNVLFPLCVGALLDASADGWRYAYIMCGGFIWAAGLVAIALIPRIKRVESRPFDWAGSAFFALCALALIFVASSVMFAWGWYITAALAFAAAAFLGVFVRLEVRDTRAELVMPLRRIVNRNSVVFFANICLVFGANSANTFLLPYVLDIGFAFTSVDVSLFFALAGVGYCALLLLAGTAIGSTDSRILYFLAGAILGIAVALEGIGTAFAVPGLLFAAQCFIGFGICLFRVSNLKFVHLIAGAELPLFGGLMETFTCLGQAIVTAFGALALHGFLAVFERGTQYDAAADEDGDAFSTLFLGAVSCVFWVLSLVLLICAALAVLLQRPRPIDPEGSSDLPLSEFEALEASSESALIYVPLGSAE
eukprot:gnl/Chilomastix_cuspidata/4482.p2 GENE.gnl/Chilomastix_cuspidata/4482~~gnl/Chilomastix_cuspidata/4482.p2  ORF type:complete len:433 (-),score=244.44 gnl/Chilomastix_cuspidata/4482:56-1354(-)